MVTLHKCCKSRSLLLCSYDYRKEEKSKEKGGQGKVGQFLEFKFNRIVLSFFTRGFHTQLDEGPETP